MDKSSIIVLVIIGAISFSYAFFVYMTITSALESKAIEFYSGYAQGIANTGSARSDEELAIVSSLCSINIMHTEKLPQYNFSSYLYERKNCDIIKINSLGSSLKSPNETSTYLALTISLAMENIAKEKASLICERYPKENVLFVEKIYDTLDTLLTVSYSGASWAQMQEYFSKCGLGSSNKSVDLNCINALLEAERKSTSVLIGRVNFNDFEHKCQESKLFSDSSISFGGLININSACQRIKEISSELSEKSLQESNQDTVNGRFFKALIFYQIANMDKDSQVVADEVAAILKDNIAHEYRQILEK
jgi:hypothetical protein